MNNLDKIAGGFPKGELICFSAGRSGGKSYAIAEKLAELKNIPLTQPEKKASIAPSTLLVKLIGRI